MNDQEKDAFLERAAGAYAERHQGASPDAARTRARILATRDRSGRRTWLALAAAVLLAFGVGLPTAWAWSTGRLDALFRAEEPVEPRVTEDEPAEPDPPARVRVREARRSEPEPQVIEAPIPPPIAPVVAQPTLPQEEEEQPVVDPTERRAYRTAHALHFEAHDPSGALAAWDSYLDTYPSGRFAIEARYNRALCLVRLNRDDEARAALAPFAEGRHGEYRQREASQLIEALSE